MIPKRHRNRCMLSVIFMIGITKIHSYNCNPTQTRREIMKTLTKGGMTVIATSIPFWSRAPLLSNINTYANAATNASPTVEEEIESLQNAYTALTSLLNNWDKATIDCTYADVPRELLEQRNKAELLEKASTFALFDKSTSVVSCRKNNKIVRDYLGVTGKGPMVGIEKRLLKRNLVNEVDPDNLETYFDYSEKFSQALSKASSLSYMAGVADFDSVNNFAKGSESDVNNGDGNSNLDQTKQAIGDIQASLGKILSLVTDVNLKDIS